MNASHHSFTRILEAILLGVTTTTVATAATFVHDREIPAPMGLQQMVYSPAYQQLVARNAKNAVYVIDAVTGTKTSRLATYNFTDIAIAPDGQFVFAAEYGGEQIGNGLPQGQSSVHRIDLATGRWAVKKAWIAGRIEAVSSRQVLLQSLDQWVTFTNDLWAVGGELRSLNTPTWGGEWGPGYFAGVYYGDIKYDSRTSRVIHGNTGLSSSEIQAFKLIGNEFVQQEGTGTYGSANAYGGTSILSTDGSVFYYGNLAVDARDVTKTKRVYPEYIYAASGLKAFGNGRLYNVNTGAVSKELPFRTTVYALSPDGREFWAYDDAAHKIHHYALVD